MRLYPHRKVTIRDINFKIHRKYGLPHICYMGTKGGYKQMPSYIILSGTFSPDFVEIARIFTPICRIK